MIVIELHEPHRAEVTIVSALPRLLLRLLRRPAEITRFVVLGRCGHWHFDDTGLLVTDAAILACLDAAIAEHRSRAPVREALERSNRSTPPPLN